MTSLSATVRGSHEISKVPAHKRTDIRLLPSAETRASVSTVVLSIRQDVFDAYVVTGIRLPLVLVVQVEPSDRCVSISWTITF